MSDPEAVVQRRIEELIAQHGGLRAAARAIGIEHVYFWQVRRGRKRASDNLLDRMGLERVIQRKTDNTQSVRRTEG